MNGVTALRKGSSFITPPCKEATKRPVYEAVSMFSPDAESSVVLILGFLTSRLSIYKFPCLQISQKMKYFIMTVSGLKQPHLCECHTCFACMPSLGKNLRKVALCRSCFTS